MEGLGDDGSNLGSFAITGELQTRNVAACLVDELSDTFDSLAPSCRRSCGLGRSANRPGNC